MTLISERARRDILPPVILALILAAVYWKLALLRGLLITDDVFTSDIMNEGFPYRFALSSALKHGNLPLWFTTIYGGFPLLARAEAGIAYPLNLLAFGLLPPYVALNFVIVTTVLIAGFGTYFYVRELGIESPGAVFSGLAFGLSGFMVSHLKHLSMVNAACWMPWGLLALERGIAGKNRRPLVWFALVFGLQILSGHIQIAYYAGLLYVVYSATRLYMLRQTGSLSGVLRDKRVWLIVSAMAVSVLLGAIQIIPTYELVGLSQRAGGVSFEYASRFPFDPGSLLKFFLPTVNGEIGDLSYRGSGIYWEDYGYAGILTMVSALYALSAGRKRWETWFFGVAGIVALALVLGKNTPFFRMAFSVVPFLRYFRFPTRFLSIVDLSLAVLGGVGMSVFFAWIFSGRRSALRRGVFLYLPWILVAFSTVDLAFFQSRQNAIAPMSVWTQEPGTATELRPRLGGNRIFSVGSELTHTATFQKAGGWLGPLEPFARQREFLQPSSNVLYGIPSPNGYAQLTPIYVVDVWGDQNRPGLMQALWRVAGQTIETRPPFKRILSMNNVAYILSPLPISGESFPLDERRDDVLIYRNPECMPHAFLVGRVIKVADTREALGALLSDAFDPRHEAVVEGAPGIAQTDSLRGDAKIVSYMANNVLIHTAARTAALLVLSDMFYPGWEAAVDGRPAPIYRVNATMRGVAVPEGDHEIAFTFRPASVRWGAIVSTIGILLLCTGFIVIRTPRP
jgi:hypothetical protein